MRKTAAQKKEPKRILFDEKDLDFRVTEFQEKEILRLWKEGKSVRYIAKAVKRNPHEVFFTLYEYGMDGKIDDIQKAFSRGSSLLVPGKELIRRGKGEQTT
ncbi:helix-turn-helix domain-containing protein [Ornithinibacillus sp. JPR2-1]|uniref:helix-turn-helix domain-containing protein n=1 Tax=Ornithinibacillus sp. JPR2-1 TaxID=2094019 RepID=UPI0031DC7E3C